MNYLSKEEVLKNGIEFAGEVCFSGEYGQQVYTKDESDGGVPVEGILYEKYSNGNLNYYAYYKDGIPNGEEVWFYESGKVKSYCIMASGTIEGEHTEWYENGSIKLVEYCKYGFVLKMQRFDENGNLIEEKNNLTDDEKRSYEKWSEYYDGRENQ